MLKFSNTLTKLFLASYVLIGLTGCLSTALTGAQLVYEQHSLKHQITNQYLSMQANHALFEDKSLFKGDQISVTSFNHDLLLIGQVASLEKKQLAESLVKNIKGVRRLFNQLEIKPVMSAVQKIKDGWLTAKIRSQMLFDSQINQKAFKVLTENGVVYLMGDVKRNQASRVVALARSADGVKRVVRIFRYYQYV